MKILNYILALSYLFTVYSCNTDDAIIVYPEEIQVAKPEIISVKGIYILNEGTMGGNNSSLDFFNYETGVYTRNYFALQNLGQSVLGDVGNDLKIYGKKLYAVINASNYLEIMNSETGMHLKGINIANCRNITFHEKYAYVTSYAGPVNGNRQLGLVYKIDTAALKIVGKILVGYQPNGIAVSNNKLYVANSGGYNNPDYEKDVSVIDINIFKEVKRIETGLNLSQIEKDKNGLVWVVSIGNYNDVGSSISAIDPIKDQVVAKLNITISNYAIYNDKLYYYGSVWIAGGTVSNYGIIDINTKKIITNSFIQESKVFSIASPYGIGINPVNGDIFIADAVNYISPGKIYIFNTFGEYKGEWEAGIMPSKFTFLFRKEKD